MRLLFPTTAACVVTLALGLFARAQEPPELVAPTGPRLPAAERAGFKLPEGFEAQLVASEPTINKPMNISFDDRGRLWVTSTVEYPFPAPDSVKPRDRVIILEDFGPDGLARKSTTFADGLNIPIGILPLGDGHEALVHSIPNILKLTDTDGDGKADVRTPIYKTFGHRDTHGMTNAFAWGFDGWIYACHGFNNESKVEGSDKKPIIMQSGNTYRMKPDGTHLEYVTHGQVNPFGLSFDPLGNLYSTDCHTRPVYQLLRGGWYPSFGKPHDGLGFAPEMMTHDHGSTGIAGITYYAADAFPREYHDNLFVGNVVTARINRDRLERHGSTYKAIEQPDFMSSEDPWFRPVDIRLGPDGALYVADFYNKVIGHYEVPLTHPGRDRERGRIWRIVYKGKDGKIAGTPAPQDFSKASVTELVANLSHPNLTVRTKATNNLVTRGKEAVAPILLAYRSSKDPNARSHALWAAERLEALTSKDLTAATQDKEAVVRTHAIRILSERPTLSSDERILVLTSMKDEDAFVRRATADALGRHPGAENIRPLIDLKHSVAQDDTHLLHVVRMALRDQLIPSETWTKLGQITPEDARDLADVAPGVPTVEAASFLLEFAKREPASLAEHARQIARYGSVDTVASLLPLARNASDLLVRVAILKAIQQGTQERGAVISQEARQWAVELTATLLSSDQLTQINAGIDLASSFRLSEAIDPLGLLVERATIAEASRIAAINSLMSIDPTKATATVGKVVADTQATPSLREQASAALSRINSPEARGAVLAAIATAPARVQSSIAAGLASSPAGAEALLAAMEAGKASPRLLQEKGVELRLTAAKPVNLNDRLGKLLAGLPPADTKMQELMAKRRSSFAGLKTDQGRGAQVFNQKCATCHQIGGQGAKVGPQLDGVGYRGLDRLIEDVLDPNRNVDQAFRTTSLALKDGQVISGLLLREEGEVLVLADTNGKDVRISKSSVDERSVSSLSPMPANMGEQVSEAEFADLMGFLLTQRPKDQIAKP